MSVFFYLFSSDSSFLLRSQPIEKKAMPATARIGTGHQSWPVCGSFAAFAGDAGSLMFVALSPGVRPGSSGTSGSSMFVGGMSPPVPGSPPGPGSNGVSGSSISVVWVFVTVYTFPSSSVRTVYLSGTFTSFITHLLLVERFFHSYRQLFDLFSVFV